MSGNRQYKLSASNIGWDKKDDPRVIARMKELEAADKKPEA